VCSSDLHRPRGLWGAGVEEPNALVDIAVDGRNFPVSRATMEPVVDGMVVTTVNGSRDRAAFLDRFARFIPAAFYYKTFMWPDWHLFEPTIRNMAGLGRVDPEAENAALSIQKNHHCDVLVIGGGPAGLATAREATSKGTSVLLVDDQQSLGGSLLHIAGNIENKPSDQWLDETVGQINASGGTVLSSTTAFGIYDHGMVALTQRHFDGRSDTLWRVRPKRIVLATGAIERPLVFQNNDRPGVMSADAALKYLNLYGVLSGERIAITTNNDSAYEVARVFHEAGAAVTILDSRSSDANLPNPDGIIIIYNATVEDVLGKNSVEAVKTENRVFPADCLLVSGGWTPTVHLYCQARGKLRWSEEIAAFVPDKKVDAMSVIGAANGTFDLDISLKEAVRAGNADVQPLSGAAGGFAIVPKWHTPKQKGRAWIDFQNDVTIKDVELAHRENFQSVEHLKRYTTLGMANDQGKTSNVNGLAAMAALTGKTIDQVGTTTYRPPFTPVPFSSFAGWRSGELNNPVRRLPLETTHREDGAVFREYGGWLRPAFYGRGEADDEIAREAKLARKSVALFDGSSLGKIEVMGPDAARFLDFHYYNTVSTLKNGRIRYGFMLTEGGVVYDDGVLARLSDEHFIVSCSSSHTDGVYRRLEAWRQDIFDPARVYILNATAQWAILTVTGPNSRKLLEKIDLGVDLTDAAMPHMSMRCGEFAGQAVRLSRVSFSGDRSYEIAMGATGAARLWHALQQEGTEFDAGKIGVEAMSILRAEKGFIIIGKDTDGTTMPMDLGISGPLEKKQTEYLGKRSLFTDAATHAQRNQLVGLEVTDDGPMLATGAHAIDRNGNDKASAGYVTSSYFSPNLDRPIALGLIRSGQSRLGEEIEIFNHGEIRKAKITHICAFDPKMERINA